MANYLKMLIAERDRLSRAIDILQQGEGESAAEAPAPKRRGRKPGSKNAPKKKGRRSMSPEARKAVSERMKKYWAARRRAKGKGRGKS